MDGRISEAELAIMEALWRDAPLSAAEIARRVAPERGWSLQTVKTLISRLDEKGAISHRQDGRRYLYSPEVAREAYVTRESRRFVERLFGGKVMPLVAHLADSDALSEEDIAEIEKLIRELKR
ncbi:MAG: BlaI/MecI/CopY family transcriptional regulator [Sphingomonadales bacterium]|nr:BlaI/MecI/CopY family transcriptional regulator [Sphingomonadales bacterium]